MPCKFIWGPVGDEKHHARMALLSPPPRVTLFGHTFLQNIEGLALGAFNLQRRFR